MLGEVDRAQRPLPRPRLRAACPTSTSASSSARSSRSTRTLGRRAARRARRAATAPPQRARAGGELGRALPALLQGLDAARAGRARHRLLRAPGDARRAVRRRPAERADERGERTRLGLYKRGGKVELSEAMPMLEDLGLRVIEEVPTRLRGGDGETWVQDFGVLGPGRQPLDLDAHGARVADCIAAVRRGDTESDSLNRLVLAARARLAPGRDPARLPQVPPAHRLALHRALPERRAGGERGDHARSSCAVRAALRPRARARRGRRGGAARGDPRDLDASSRSTTTASCATSSG